MRTTPLNLQKALIGILPTGQTEEQAVLAVADQWLASDSPVLVRRGLFAWCNLRIGLRVSEIHRVEIADFDFSRAILHVWRHKRKGRGYVQGLRHSGAEREAVNVSDDLLRRVLAYLKRSGRASGPLFLTETGRAASQDSLENDWYLILAAAGVPKRGCHAGRHTVGTLLGHHTGNAVKVRDQLGHSSIAISDQYINRNPLSNREVLNEVFNAA